MQVGAADSARTHGDQNLARAGDWVGHVVAIYHPALSQHCGAHQLFSLSILSSSVCSVIALTTASPARPSNCSRMLPAHLCDARGASSCALKCGITLRAKR